LSLPQVTNFFFGIEPHFHSPTLSFFSLTIILLWADQPPIFPRPCRPSLAPPALFTPGFPRRPLYLHLYGLWQTPPQVIGPSGSLRLQTVKFFQSIVHRRLSPAPALGRDWYFFPFPFEPQLFSPTRSDPYPQFVPFFSCVHLFFCFTIGFVVRFPLFFRCFCLFNAGFMRSIEDWNFFLERGPLLPFSDKRMRNFFRLVCFFFPAVCRMLFGQIFNLLRFLGVFSAGLTGRDPFLQEAHFLPLGFFFFEVFFQPRRRFLHLPFGPTIRDVWAPGQALVCCPLGYCVFSPCLFLHQGPFAASPRPFLFRSEGIFLTRPRMPSFLYAHRHPPSSISFFFHLGTQMTRFVPGLLHPRISPRRRRVYPLLLVFTWDNPDYIPPVLPSPPTPIRFSFIVVFIRVMLSPNS